MNMTRPLSENYNYLDWSKYQVRKPEDKPKGSHYAAVLFEDRTEWTPPYDSYDNPSGSTARYTDTKYFSFPDKETLHAWLLRAKKSNFEFFFFEVKKVGEVELKVNVDVGL